jgi:hypothetical protein
VEIIMLTVDQKRQELVSFELDWFHNNGTEEDIVNVMRYVDALYNSYTDKEIDKQYETKYSKE